MSKRRLVITAVLTGQSQSEVARTKHRYTADSDGTGTTPARASSTRIRRGPQNGRARRISNTRASTAAAI